VVIEVESVHVAQLLEKAPVRALATAIAVTGAETRLPLYLVPSVYATLPRLRTGAKLMPSGATKVEAIGPGRWNLLAAGHQEASCDVAIAIPETAKAGDLVLVKVTAHYPKRAGAAARAVEFLQVVHVRD